MKNFKDKLKIKKKLYLDFKKKQKISKMEDLIKKKWIQKNYCVIRTLRQII